MVATTDEAARRREREIFEEDNDFDRHLALLGPGPSARTTSARTTWTRPSPTSPTSREKGGRTGAAKLIERARSEQLTLRQVAQSLAEFRRSPFVGAPETVADRIEEWFDAGTFDGTSTRPSAPRSSNFALFVGGVVPVLQKRDLFRTEYEADTLRGGLRTACPGQPPPPPPAGEAA